MMTEHTHETRVQQLYVLVELHPHRDELLELMMEQLAEMELDGDRG